MKDLEKLSPTEKRLFDKLLERRGFKINETLDSFTIQINPDRINIDDFPLIKDLFILFLKSEPQTEIAIEIEIPYVIRLIRKQTSGFNIRLNSDKLAIITSVPIIINPTLFSATLVALEESNIAIDLNKIITAIIEQINEEIKEADETVINNLSSIIDFLQKKYSKEPILQNIIPYFLNLLIKTNKIDNSFGWDNKYWEVIKEVDGKPLYFLHEASKQESNFFLYLLYKLKDQVSFPYDDNNNNLLHLCHNKHLETAFKLTPDINHQNSDGNTALHIAAYEGNIDKAFFLLQKNANPDIKNKYGETFWTILPTKKFDDLHLYRLYGQYGKVLKLPLKIKKQKGPTCGFYAAAFAAEFHYYMDPDKFKQKPPTALKKDSEPKAKTSLRYFRTELNIPGRGSIFKTQELAKVIDKTGCKSLIIDIKDEKHFLEIIKNSIEQNRPIIIPCAMDTQILLDPNTPKKEYKQSLKAGLAHWATIIGWASDGKSTTILLAQNGKYYEVMSDKLFNAFYNIEPIFPEHYIYKAEKGKDWVLEEKPIKKPENASENFLTEIIPETRLDEDFMRKLVIVLPPDSPEPTDTNNNNASFKK